MSSVYSKKMTTISASACASIIALACSAPAQAQVVTSDIIVTATRATTATKTDTPILRIPQSINIVTPEQIGDLGARSIVEALSYTAGVAGGNDDSRGDFNNVRGFESVLYVDGLKRNFGFVYLPRADVNALERIEVLVGPASVLYGAGSSGGLTNMQSKRPKFEFGGTVSASYGTYERKEGVVDVYGPLTDTIAFRFVGLARDSNSRQGFTPNNRILVQPAITWKPTERTEVTALGLYQRDKNPPNYNVLPLPASIYAGPGQRVPDTRFLGEPSYADTGYKKNGAATLLISHEFAEAIRFNSSTRYSRAFTDQREVYPAPYFNPLNPFVDENGIPVTDPATSDPNATFVPRNIFAIKVHYRTFNSDNNIGVKFDTGPLSHRVLVGADYSYFRQLAAQAFSATTPIDIYNPVYGTAPLPSYGAQSRQVVKQLGFYAQDQIDFGEIASLVLGIRRDRVTKVETFSPRAVDKKTTKRAGLTVNVTPTIAPYISYSESFLPVSGLNQFGGSFVPLSGKQKEVGVKWQPFKTTMLRATYYTLKEDNALRTDPNNPLNSIQTGSTKAKGFEFQLDHNVVNDISLTANFSHGTVRQSGDGRQRDNTAKDLAGIYLTKTTEISEEMSLRYGGGVRYVGKQTSGDATFLQVVTPSYTLADAIVAIDYGKWTLQVNALNLFDEQYYPTCYNFGFCANGERRTIQGTLSYRF